MTQHYQRNTTGIWKYCPTCGRKTMHRVDDRRVGVCTEQHVTGLSKAQQKREEKRLYEEQNPDLFEEVKA